MRVPRDHRRLSPNRARAFTLVEILIVVIILGIMGTIIIGLFQNASADARANSLKDNLRNLRSQLQLYLAQHGSYPTQAGFVTQMTQYTDGSGTVSATRSPAHPYGPYILQMPPLPVGTEKGKTGVTTMTYTAGFGWGYDATTGSIRANLPDTDVDDHGVRYNTY